MSPILQKEVINVLETQLVRLQKEVPMLLRIIDQAIQGVYRRIDEGTKTIRSDELISRKSGYFYYILTEPTIRRSVEEAGLKNVSVFVESNGNGTPHLEIHTPYAILCFSRVRHSGDVPNKAKYRQKYIDQTFMYEVYPELHMYTPECKPLYVVTYALPKTGDMPVEIKIGRLTVDQEAWSCNYNLADIINKTDTVEKVVPKNDATPLENIQRNVKIRVKK